MRGETTDPVDGSGRTTVTDAPGATATAAGPAPEAPTDLVAVAKALSDPIRLRMLELMSQGRECCGLTSACTRGVPGTDEPLGICVCEFQEQFGLGQSKTSYHLRVLKDAGLVTEETRGKWTFYALDHEAADRAMAALRGLIGG